MNKYYCKVCAYIYDPAKNNDVLFENLPDDYICPLCGVGKDQFEIIHYKGEPTTGGEAQEKHVPVIEVEGNKVTVKVGSIAHPMEEAHYITAVELYNGEMLIERKTLLPGQIPQAIYENVSSADKLKALAYCNIHGIWESNI